VQALREHDDLMLTSVRDAVIALGSVRAIYLFGSRARGDARADSAYEVLVVTWGRRPDADTRLAIRRAVSSSPPTCEMHYVTAAEFEWRKRFANSVERAADREGVILHMADEMEERYAAAMRWFDEADMDREFAEFAMQSEHRVRRACFHAQQCVEKDIKAFLTLVDIDALRTHELDTLVTQCAEADLAFLVWVERLGTLSDYAVETRYQGGPETTMAEAREAMTLVEQFRLFVQERVAVYRGETQ
jgi:HEPN domain-containing protein/predicted nucleotidyltransferase